ncbi:peptidase domain-containing ABC transporter [Roseateles cellulosilyticus]|uniref:ATP-binding cassette domain-containing protein n=1 Tax=Pelomonas cellulosilytica TaxID=2906762 RepID=A0ABS8XL04_9BURK|nr:ATP-binding cassette domain-containing protein [Pelomonas sp. P8]MCE4553511.1 ATP-binding cassette domain-containing protein [Pelomonas sp. P8]
MAVASLLVNALVLTLPLFSMLVYDKAVGNELHETLWALSIGMGLLFALELVLRLSRVLLVEHAGARWDMHLDERLLRGVLATPASKPLQVGTLLSRYRELGATRDVLSAQFLLPLADVPFALLFAIVLAVIAGPLVLIPIGVGLALLGAGGVLQAAAARRSRVASQAASTKLSWLVDVLLARESVMSAAAARVAERGLREPSATAARAGSRARVWQQVSQQLLPVGMSACTVLTLVAGVYRIEAQALSVGGLISTTMLGGRLVSSICMFAPVMLRWQEFMRALRDMAQTVALDAATLPDRDTGGPLGAAAAEGVRLAGVGFAYPDKPAVLSDVTVTLKPGEMVAVVGSSGAGKSTLLRLLAGHLVPTSGQFALGGRVVSDDLTRRWLAGAVAYKPQEPGFLAGRLQDIVAPGEDGAREAELLRALRVAGLGPQLDRGELGLNTELGSNGAGLSGGQRQMLALARVLHQSSDLLLLDEPTLGLDRQAQEGLIAALPGWKDGCCVVVATHSAELIQVCDRVLVLDRGRVVADAPPQRLLAPGAVTPRTPAPRTTTV